MKRSPERSVRTCSGLLFVTSLLHIAAGIGVIVFQVMLIIVGSPFHDVGGGLWAGPIFFIQGVLGFITVCDNLMCSVVSFLVSSILSALLTVGLMAVAAIDLGSVYKCLKDQVQMSYAPTYCASHVAPRIQLAGWGIVGTCCVQLLASVCSVYFCIRVIYSDNRSLSRPTTPYLYDEIPSPAQSRFQDGPGSSIRKSSYSLTSTLPARSKSVDEFSQTESEGTTIYHSRPPLTSSSHFVSHSRPALTSSARSVNLLPDGSVQRKTVRNASSLHTVAQTRVRSTSIRSVHPDELPGYVKHTAV